jgi:hypothetical protein
MRRGHHALFHAIVTMGAASVQGACGGVATDASQNGEGDGHSGSGGVASSSLSAGGAPELSSGGAPFFSSSGGTSSGGSLFVSAGGSVTVFDAGSPFALATLDGGPFLEGCAHSAQIQCSTWAPVPQGCYCDTSAPLSQSDCEPCAVLSCYSYAPQVGCHCVVCIR